MTADCLFTNRLLLAGVKDLYSMPNILIVILDTNIPRSEQQ
jgi:hypothetical protein